MAGTSSVFAGAALLECGRIFELRVKEAAAALEGTFSSYFDAQMHELVVLGLARATADEGTIWLLDEPRESLVPVFNSGPHAIEFVGKFRQKLSSGMISMVVATEQPICENAVNRNHSQDKTLDYRLGVQTCAMIAVPFYFAGELRGVLSGVQLREKPTDNEECRGFRWEQLQGLQRTAAVFARLLEHKILTRVLAFQPRA